MSNPLTFLEISELFRRNSFLAWHKDYQFLSWKDGPAPLKLVHLDPNLGFIGYNCSNPTCSRCNSSSLLIADIGGHHILLKENGYAIEPKHEWIEGKKQTIHKTNPNPVFIKT